MTKLMYDGGPCCVSIILQISQFKPFHYINEVITSKKLFMNHESKRLEEKNKSSTSTFTWPANRVLFAKMLWFPTLQSCAM